MVCRYINILCLSVVCVSSSLNMSSVIQHSECNNVIKIHNGIFLISSCDCNIHVYVFSTSVCFLFVGSLAVEEILVTWLLLMEFTKWGYLPSQCATTKCPKALNLISCRSASCHIVPRLQMCTA